MQGSDKKLYNLRLVHISNSVGDFSPGKCDRVNDMQDLELFTSEKRLYTFVKHKIADKITSASTNRMKVQ
jgi:hypothetical protein